MKKRFLILTVILLGISSIAYALAVTQKVTVTVKIPETHSKAVQIKGWVAANTGPLIDDQMSWTGDDVFDVDDDKWVLSISRDDSGELIISFTALAKGTYQR